MKVTIMYRNSYIGGGGWVFYPMTVEIGDNCPKCGVKRGEPYSYSFRENDTNYTVDRWDNPCGHIDYYVDVYVESYKLWLRSLSRTEQSYLLYILRGK